MIQTLKPKISIVVDGVEIRGWETYQIDTSMTDGVFQFSLRMPFDLRAWQVCREDRPCQVLVDGIAVITGYIDDSDNPEDNPNVIEVKGRCKCARLQHDCPPTINFGGLGLQELTKKLVAPMFADVVFSNARNRAIVRGRGKKARAGSEPLKISAPKKVGTRIEPGQTRLAVVSSLCEQAGLLHWCSGDGREFIVAKPNYQQEAQFRFFRPAPGSSRAAESTVLSLGIHRSTADRYSRVICVGSGAGTDANYGPTCASRFGEARNNPLKAGGEGIDFSAPKTLIVQRAVKSAEEAREFAEAEMARRDASGHTIGARAGGHGQVIAGTYRTMFANDLVVNVEDERTGTVGPYLISSTSYSSGRGDGEETSMKLVPKGAELTK